MTVKNFKIREATSSDTLQIIDFTFKAKNALHFPPAQLEWMLKQENSPFFTFLYFEDAHDSHLSGLLIGKQKPNQLEVLELYTLNEQKDYKPLLEHLVQHGLNQNVEGIFGLFPIGEIALETALKENHFQISKVIEKYYTNGENANLWTKMIF